jgi:lipopolysaccharide/colanic/teichoic acid biosynthesis glycosyltransferase
MREPFGPSGYACSKQHEHWSIWRDIKIILLTFRVLLHRNAY